MANTVTIKSRGCNLELVTGETRLAWERLFRYTALQTWTWRGGEAIVCCDYAANYGRGEYAVVVRTGGVKLGTVRVLYVANMLQAMEALGLTYRVWGTRKPRAPRTTRQTHRATLAVGAHRLGNTFRTMRRAA